MSKPWLAHIIPSLFAALFSLTGPSLVLASPLNYFVAPTGCSDGSSGSITAPFCTIPRGLTAMSPGDTLLLRAGTYPSFEVTKSGTSGNYIRIESYNHEPVKISGGSSGITLSGKSYIQIKDLEITGATGSYGAGILLKNSSHHNLILSNSIHDNLGSKTHGIIIDHSSYNRVENNQVFNNYSVGIKVQGTSTANELIGNTSYHNVGDPPNSDGIALSGEFTTHALVQNNHVYDNGDDGIDTWSSSGHTIIGNRVHHNGVAGGDGNGLKLGGTSTGGRHLVVGNLSYSNKRDGFDSNHSGGTTYLNNVAYDNASVGYQDGEGKLAPCTPSTCQTTYINNVGYNNRGGNFSASEFTAVSHNNLWYSDNTGPQISYRGTRYSSLAAFYSSSTSRLDNPADTVRSSLSLNPQFADPSSGNFTPSASSPLINAGDPANPGQILAVGRPDIGAVEYGGSPSNTPSPSPTPVIKPGDFNLDTHVNAIDYSIFVAGFPTKYSIFDYALLISNYGQ